MSRAKASDDRSYYSGVVAARLRQLRKERKLTSVELVDRIRLFGTEHVCRKCKRRKVSISDRATVPCCWPNCDGVMDACELNIAVRTLNSWENAIKGYGASFPMDMVPIIAKVYGFGSPLGWMPDEFPED